MKRSDMVTIIAEALIEPKFPTDVFKQADYILSRLEIEGIAPPYVDAIFQKNCKIYIDATGREWEPEDEET